MTTSSLDQLKDDALNSYIDFKPEHVRLIRDAADWDELDAILKQIVPQYNQQ